MRRRRIGYPSGYPGSVWKWSTGEMRRSGVFNTGAFRFLVISIPLLSCASAPEQSASLVDKYVRPEIDESRVCCGPSEVLASLGLTRLLVGVRYDDPDATQEGTPYDLRNVYLAGGLCDGPAPCGSCTSCTAGGRSCASADGGCPWWGCWQWDELPPGDFVSSFAREAAARGEIPMFTYYQWLALSGGIEGTAEIQALDRLDLTLRYFNDFRFFLESIEDVPSIVHLEPDLWGFAQQFGGDPVQLPAQVSEANPWDCDDLEDTLAGFGRCLIRMVRIYAPSSLVALHASGWSTGTSVLFNRDPDVDVSSHAEQTAAYLEACGATSADIIVADITDRDAGYYEREGLDTWWDPTNESLPDFEQGIAWGAALSRRLDTPVLWWQIPVGNTRLPNREYQWQDNRVDYFLEHMADVASGLAVGVVFGAGAEGQTSPLSDEGNLHSRFQAYLDAGGVAPEHE